MLLRFRRRFEVDWRPVPRPSAAVQGGGAIVTVFVAVSLLAAATAPPADSAGGIEGALSYVAHAQNRDGGFGAAPGQRSSSLITGWAAIGLESGGRHALRARHGGRTTLEFMRAQSRQGDDIGEIERTMLALHGGGLSARRFAGRNLVRLLLSARRRNGSISGQANLTAFGILALRSAGWSKRTRAIRLAVGWLERQQNGDGGFPFSRRGGTSDADDTGAVMQALAAGGPRRAEAVRRAVSYLRRSQNEDGGFGQFSRSRSNAQSTAWAVQGLAAARRRPARFRRGATRSPIAYLRSLQQADGSFRYSREHVQTPVWVTAQVIAALRELPLPIRPPRS
jgi:prenyltransferase beta subunit